MTKLESFRAHWHARGRCHRAPPILVVGFICLVHDHDRSEIIFKQPARHVVTTTTAGLFAERRPDVSPLMTSREKRRIDTAMIFAPCNKNDNKKSKQNKKEKDEQEYSLTPYFRWLTAYRR